MVISLKIDESQLSIPSCSLLGDVSQALNFNKKFPTLIIPQEAKALYANCSDIIPKLDEVKLTNVGTNYKDPVLSLIHI